MSPSSQALNVPEFNVLRQDTLVQALVEQCLRQLADAGIKVISYRMGGWLSSHHEGGKKFSLGENMLDYLISLFDNANDFSWDAAKASHAVLLCRMEQGEIKDCRLKTGQCTEAQCSHIWWSEPQEIQSKTYEVHDM